MATYLDSVRMASVTVPGGTLVELRSDGGGTSAVITLVYSAITSGTSVTTIATVPTGTTSTTFGLRGHDLDLCLVADTAGNVYVIGRRGDTHSTVLVQQYNRTGTTNAWTVGGTNQQAGTSTGQYMTQFRAVFSPGTGSSPVDTIFLMLRREGSVAYDNLSYATLRVSAITASSGSLFIEHQLDPYFTCVPPTSDASNTGKLDVAAIPNSNRIASASDGWAVVSNINGYTHSYGYAPDGSHYAANRVRIVGIDVNTFVVVHTKFSSPYNLDVEWRSATNGALLATTTIPAAAADGGTFGDEWDVYYDTADGGLCVYYVSATGSSRQIERIDVSPLTYVAAAAVVITAAMGAASSVNSKLRVPNGTVDERRILLEAANVLSTVQSLAVISDTSGNIAPFAPTLVVRTNYDASSTVPFSWTFADANPGDTQTARTMEIQRVSDSVNVYAPGKVSTTAQTLNLAGNTLVNGVAYRWRVQTYDILDQVGTWSGYSTFSTSAVGTLTITDPASDNLLLSTNFKAFVWTYSQANGYTQAQRRIRLTRTSDSFVVLDTTMVVSTSLTATITGLANAVEYRFDLDIINTNAQTTSATRLITASFANPMPPTLALSTGINYIQVAVTNPTPTGSHPEAAKTLIYRRLAGTTDPFLGVGSVGYNGVYIDRQVAGGIAYEYHGIASDTP